MRIALVGADRSATEYAKRIEDLEATELVGVAAGGAEHPPEPLTVTHADYETLYEETEPDGVVLCVAPAACRGPALAAAEQGLSILRPGRLAGDVADGEAIVDAVETSDTVALGGYASSFSPEDETAVRRATGGELGTVGNVRCSRRTSETDGSTDAGELAGPEIEFLRRVGGEVTHVFGRRTTPCLGTGLLVTLRLGHVVGHLDIRSSAGAKRRRFELAGTEGLIEFDSDDVAPVTIRHGGEATTEVPLEDDAVARQLTHFRDCIRGDAAPRIPLSDALSTLRIARAIDVSADRGARVAPGEVEA